MNSLIQVSCERFHVVSTWNPRGVFAGPMRFLVVHIGFLFHEHFTLYFPLFKIYFFVFFIVYRDPLYYTHFTEKICPRHFRCWVGLYTHTRKKKDLGSQEIRK